jgi:hypothetical protein
MTPEQEESVIKRLLAGTQSRKLAWTEMMDHFSFITNELGRFRYVVSSQDSDDVAPFNLEIYDMENGPITITHKIVTSEFGRANDELAALYVLVKNTVLNFQNIANDIFEDLDKFGLTE